MRLRSREMLSYSFYLYGKQVTPYSNTTVVKARAVARLSAVEGQRGGNRKYIFIFYEKFAKRLENFQ